MIRRSQSQRHLHAPRASSSRAPRGGTAVVPLDTRRIREDALQEYRQAERQLAQLKRHLQRYHSRDVPGFQAWMHRNFGRQLTRQRELLQTIEDQRMLLIEVEQWMMERGLSESAAYRHVLWRRAHPAEAEAEDRRFEERARQAADAGARHRSSDPWAADEEDDESDDDDPFAESDFADIPDDEWGAFSDLVEDFTGYRPPARRSIRPPPPEDASAKSLYRQIVRRLHPDHHGQMSEARADLWHAAQAAYRRRDVEALQGILARCESDGGALHPGSPVSVIRRLIRDLQRAMGAVRRDTRRFRREPAWDYERRVRDAHFVRRMAAGLDNTVLQLERRLQEFNREIARLDRKAAPRPRRARPTPGGIQDELPF